MKAIAGMTLAIAIIFVATAGRPTGAHAAVTSFDVQLLGANEVPPVNSPASAFARFTLDDATNVLTYALTVSGVSPDLVTAAHIHRGAAGVNGPIIHPLATTGFTQVSGSVTLTEAEVGDLRTGNLYVNVHTTDHPNGAARGQLVLPSAPAAAASFVATDANNGQTLSLAPGQSLQVVLQTTFWTFAAPTPTSVLSEQGSQVVTPAPQGTCLPGVGCGTTAATYVALAPGTAQVSASRTSCGEALRCSPEQSSFTLTVLVSGGQAITPPNTGSAGLVSEKDVASEWIALGAAVFSLGIALLSLAGGRRRLPGAGR